MYDAVDYGKKGVDFTVAMPRFKLKGKPDDLTRKVADLVSRKRQTRLRLLSFYQFKADTWVESVTAAGPFLHFQVNTFTLNRQVLSQIDGLTNKTTSGEPEYGRNESGRGKKLVIGE